MIINKLPGVKISYPLLYKGLRSLFFQTRSVHNTLLQYYKNTTKGGFEFFCFFKKL